MTFSHSLMFKLVWWPSDNLMCDSWQNSNRIDTLSVSLYPLPDKSFMKYSPQAVEGVPSLLLCSSTQTCPGKHGKRSACISIMLSLFQVYLPLLCGLQVQCVTAVCVQLSANAWFLFWRRVWNSDSGVKRNTNESTCVKSTDHLHMTHPKNTCMWKLSMSAWICSSANHLPSSQSSDRRFHYFSALHQNVIYHHWLHHSF